MTFQPWYSCWNSLSCFSWVHYHNHGTRWTRTKFLEEDRRWIFRGLSPSLAPCPSFWSRPTRSSHALVSAIRLTLPFLRAKEVRLLVSLQGLGVYWPLYSFFRHPCGRCGGPFSINTRRRQWTSAGYLFAPLTVQGSSVCGDVLAMHCSSTSDDLPAAPSPPAF